MSHHGTTSVAAGITSFLVSLDFVRVTTINGLPMVTQIPVDTISDTSMNVAGWTRNTVETIFGVWWYNAPIGLQAERFNHTQISGGDRNVYWYGGDTWYSGYTTYYPHPRGIPLDTERHILGSQHNGGSSWFDIDGDRGFGTNSTVAPVGFKWGYGGANLVSGQPTWAAGEIITVNGTLTPAEVEDVYRYLRNKWDIPIRLHVHDAWHRVKSEQGDVPLPYTDDFNRADGDPGANWVASSPGQYVISNNRLVKATGSPNWITWVPAMASSDHYVQAKFYNAAEDFAFPRARGSGTSRYSY